MKEVYYKIIQQKNIPDVFKSIIEISYSKKVSIIGSLLDKYNEKIVEKALYDYQKEYIDLGRININKMKNQIIYFCELRQRGMK